MKKQILLLILITILGSSNLNAMETTEEELFQIDFQEEHNRETQKLLATENLMKI